MLRRGGLLGLAGLVLHQADDDRAQDAHLVLQDRVGRLQQIGSPLQHLQGSGRQEDGLPVPTDRLLQEPLVHLVHHRDFRGAARDFGDGFVVLLEKVHQERRFRTLLKRVLIG